MNIPDGYRVAETPHKVSRHPEMRSRIRMRADAACGRLNAGRRVPSYRYEVVREGRRWAVYAFQNVLRKIEP